MVMVTGDGDGVKDLSFVAITANISVHESRPDNSCFKDSTLQMCVYSILKLL